MLQVLPDLPRAQDISLLAAFGTTAQQDHDATPMHSKVHPVTRPEIQAQLLHTFTNALHVGPISQGQPRQCGRNSGGNDPIEIVEPVTKRASARRVDVLDDLERNQWLHFRYYSASARYTNGPLDSRFVLERPLRAKQTGIS